MPPACINPSWLGSHQFRPVPYVRGVPVRSSLHQPNFGNLAATPVSAESRFAIPVQIKLTASRRFGRDVELDWLEGERFADEGMDFNCVVSHEANLFFRAVAAINHTEFVAGFGIEGGVAHLERRIEEGFGMVD